jgi:hypothetical protein
MKKANLSKSLIAIGILLLTLIVFSCLQDDNVYESTLGQISHNYEHVENDKKTQILETQNSYEEITAENMYRWDAKLYKTVNDSMYVDADYAFKERLAFYPLFPIVWKILMIDSPVIFIFNYAIFVLSLILLVNMFIKDTRDNLFIYVIALILPSAMIYYLPYAESLFLLTLVLSVSGLFKQKYWLFCVGACAFSMTRPAAQIYLFVLIAADIRYLFIHRNVNYFLKEIALKTAPFILGILLVILIQYSYSGSWTAYFDALTFWPAESGLFNTIIDWSIEGFGMTVFAIFFLAIPALVYALIWGVKTFMRTKQVFIQPPSLFSGNSQWIKEYLFNTSVLFIAGNLLYTFLTSGGSVNGFYRYTMCVPFFFIILFIFYEKIKDIPLKYTMLSFALCLIGMSLLLASIIYGGNRFQFSYAGLYLSLFLLLFVLLASRLSYRNKWLVTAVLLLPCIIWHSYLFNMYLCDGWIFT